LGYISYRTPLTRWLGNSRQCSLHSLLKEESLVVRKMKLNIIRSVFVLSLAALEAAASPLPPSGRGLPQSDASSEISKRTVPLTHVQHEKRTAVQGSIWAKVERARREAVLPMRIGLKQQNLMSGHDMLMDM
jgi:hypothetical protein